MVHHAAPGTAAAAESIPDVSRQQPGETTSIPATLGHKFHDEASAAQRKSAKRETAGPCADPCHSPKDAVPLAFGCIKRRIGLLPTPNRIFLEQPGLGRYVLSCS